MNPILFYCALLCQNIDYWDSGYRINSCWEVPTTKFVLRIQAMDGVKADYGFTATTWGSTQPCRRLTSEDHLRHLSYHVDFNGDGGVCR